MKKIIGIFAICGVLQSNAAQIETELHKPINEKDQSKTVNQVSLIDDLEEFFNYDVTCVYRRRTYLYGEVEITVSCMACSTDPAEASRNAAQCVADKATVALEKID